MQTRYISLWFWIWFDNSLEGINMGVHRTICTSTFSKLEIHTKDLADNKCWIHLLNDWTLLRSDSSLYFRLTAWHIWASSFQTATVKEAKESGKEGKSFCCTFTAEADFPCTFHRDRGPVTQPCWMAQVGCGSIALSNVTTAFICIGFALHTVLSHYRESQFSNARNCLLSSGGIGKNWMMELVVSLTDLCNYTMMIRQN